MDKNWVRERGRRAQRRRHWWGGGRRTVARAGRVSVFLVLSCWWGPRHNPAEQCRGVRDKGLICGGAHSYSHLYCQCVAVALIILVSLDYHIHVTFYLGNDGVMTRWIRSDVPFNWWETNCSQRNYSWELRDSWFVAIHNQDEHLCVRKKTPGIFVYKSRQLGGSLRYLTYHVLTPINRLPCNRL